MAPPSPQPEHTDETLIMVILKHLGPKALLWAGARIFGLLIQYLLPTVLLLWAATTKWAWGLWSLLLGALG